MSGDIRLQHNPNETLKIDRNQSQNFLKITRSIFYWGVILIIWTVIGIIAIALYYGARMPSATTWVIPDRAPNIKILAEDGSLIANRGSTNSGTLSLENVSPYIPEAIIAIEDKRFYEHLGIDPIGLLRALVINIINRHTVQGGSTITQQLAKNLFLSPDRTIERKVQEVLLALWLEHKYTKDQILTMYLQHVFFGSNIYGIEAAARHYFSKSARDVTLGEAAILAGILKAPSRLSPERDPKAANDRAKIVLNSMLQQGFITETEKNTAILQSSEKAKRKRSGAEHYVVDMVIDQIQSLVPQNKEDLIVETSLNMKLEKVAEKTLVTLLQKEGSKLNVSQAALVALDASGAIRALVGGRDYKESQFNRAVKAKRQPGSAFKTFLYEAALEAGLTPDSIRNDEPVRIGNWTPQNYDHKYRGPVTLTTALLNSLNSIAAQLVIEIGPDKVVKIAHRMGIESDLQANASIALGTSEVSLLELTAAYTPLMNGGYKATPHIIQRIMTTTGKVLYNVNYNNPPRVLSKSVVEEMNSMMAQVINKGTGRTAILKDWQAAGKTGTTQTFRDALFLGYTANLTVGVWFGNDNGKAMKRVTGGGLPAKAWRSFMIAAHSGISPIPLLGTEKIFQQNEESSKSQETLVDMLYKALGVKNQTSSHLDTEEMYSPPSSADPEGSNNEAIPLPENPQNDSLEHPYEKQFPQSLPEAEHSIGTNNDKSTQQGGQTTLLDIIMGH
ncbi:Multimodular transpeptidase-transglycosylase [Liberibacter crescens BT-1]|uniref:Multimodular transpeptidase-transglycosylase n=1 Tax=Liberibacter crescens (strain BT-1) TaxID=1215343 RepID=L0EUG2_LIBCB|nr:transglycosylase domain-containing protein [Liberibacter crescens]AGA65194.1 Multimodular transpeptidase-transglycosylase [Liberibacter crescens BT-1]